MTTTNQYITKCSLCNSIHLVLIKEEDIKLPKNNTAYKSLNYYCPYKQSSFEDELLEMINSESKKRALKEAKVK